MRAKDALGRYGENVAVQFLQRHGYTIVDRNWSCEHGEIDIVARDRDTLVICEVKTRRSTAFGLPEEAVTPEKIARLRRLSFCWLEDAKARDLWVVKGQHSARTIRLDVVAVFCPPKGGPQIEHFTGVG